jgi:hypothetical protein
MSVMLDGKLVFVLNLIGFNWPSADEDKLKECARHWREYATELEHTIADSRRILNQVRAENSGESIDALEKHWLEVGGHLRQAQDAAHLVAQGLDEFAVAVEALKVAVAIQLGILAGELAATTGGAVLTFGLAELAVPAEIVGTQIIVRRLTGLAIHKVEQVVVQKFAKAVAEHFLSIKNGLKALKASRTALKDFGKGLVKGGEKDLKNVGASVERDGMDVVKSPSVTPAYKFKLAPADIPKSRSVHFNRANKDLEGALKTNPDVAKRLEDSPGVQERVSSLGGRKNPKGYVWHHSTIDQAGEPGQLDLVSKAQHTEGSPEWNLLHPDGKGGYSEWAIPAGAPKN